MDVTGGANYSFMGTNQMMSVPYALYAESANINYDSISNFLSGDSTFITNVGSGMGGGGCDFQFPEGLDGDPVVIDLLSNNYTVPAGKKLYLTSSVTTGGSPGFLIIDGFNVIQSGNFSIPMIAKSGDVLGWYDPNGNTPTSVVATGILVDENPQVQIISIDLMSGNYTVPSSKKMVLYHAYHEGATGYINVNGQVVFEAWNRPLPSILNAGDIVSMSGNPTYTSAFGYLVDENYFAGCGGGGSSSATTNATIDSLSQVVSNLDSSLTALTSQFNFGCNDPTACNYDATANFNDGSCIFPDGCTDPNAINYDTTAICDDGSCVSAIGQYYQGGIIAYIDATGLHGLIVSPDIGNASWGCSGTNLPGADGTAIGAGNQNTIDIINGCMDSTAASLCGNLVLNGYSDWFLPSKDELYQLYLNTNLMPGVIAWSAIHFSSSEADATGAWLQIFSNGSQQNGSKNNVYPVIAVRQF
jgi:hypothetical protein